MSSGATGALLVSNRPFGFVALLGLIALAGMIMRNTVILVDQIDRDIAAGHARHRAIIDATVRRARPVALTALAAIPVIVVSDIYLSSPQLRKFHSAQQRTP